MASKLLILPSLTLLLVLAGCGGGSSSSGGGSVPTGSSFGMLTVNWPSRARLVPEASNSIVINLKLNGKAVALPVTIPRPDGDAPTTTTKIDNLAYGTYTLDIASYPTTDGLVSNPSAVAQATGTGSMTVTEDVPGAATVTLNSTITKLAVGAVSVDKGKTASVTVSATDKNGAIVLLSAGGGTEPIQWTTGSTAIATTSGTGPTVTLTGVHSGDTTIKAALPGSGAAPAMNVVKVNVVNDGTGTVTIQ